MFDITILALYNKCCYAMVKFEYITKIRSLRNNLYRFFRTSPHKSGRDYSERDKFVPFYFLIFLLFKRRCQLVDRGVYKKNNINKNLWYCI